MKLKNTNLAFIFFILGVFFLPFNSFEGVGLLGEFSRDSCFFFFLFSGLILFVDPSTKVPLRTPIFQIILLFVIWVILGSLFNLGDMLNYYFKQTTGSERFIRQFIALVLSTLFLFITFYNVLRVYDLNTTFNRIRRTVLISLYFVTAYAVFEVLIIKFGYKDLSKVLQVFDFFPFTDVGLDQSTRRISSVTFEAPALATYLISISGWMFSYILTGSGLRRFLPAIIVLLLVFLSGSRAGFFIIIIQTLLFVLYIAKDKKFNRLFLNFVIISGILGSAVALLYSKTITSYVVSEIDSFKTTDETHAISNKSRFGIQEAMFYTFLDNPVLGTGYGLQAFESKDKYPSWATYGNWEFRLKYLNEGDKRFPPGYNLYLRILAETGIVGFLIFGLLLSIIVIWCINNAFLKQGGKTILPLIIAISMIGFIFNWLKMDTFRIYFFWICLALMVLIEKNKVWRIDD